MPKCSNGNPDCKSFKVLGSGIGFKGGRYVAENKMKAAKRAGSKLYKKIDNDPRYSQYKNKTSIKFIMGETTIGSPKKSTAYEVKRSKLAEPKKIKIGNTVVEYKYKYTVHKLSIPDSEMEKMM
tara:strand:+ start:76 stop:447 length:372 start_codon:yes stop_codon:yes gene_type:complete